MARTNGKSEVDPVDLDAEHELPAAEEDGDGTGEARSAASDAGQVVQEERGPGGHDVEFEKLKRERDTLLDRLARLQAEFENSRKRAAREQQEFREYALADAMKAILPALDSFERALHTSAADQTECRTHLQAITGCTAKTGTAPDPG